MEATTPEKEQLVEVMMCPLLKTECVRDGHPNDKGQLIKCQWWVQANMQHPDGTQTTTGTCAICLGVTIGSETGQTLRSLGSIIAQDSPSQQSQRMVQQSVEAIQREQEQRQQQGNEETSQPEANAVIKH